MSTTYISESYRQHHAGEEPSYAEAKLVELNQRAATAAANLPEREGTALLQAVSGSRSELVGAGEAVDRLLGQRDIFHVFRREVYDGLQNAQSHPHAALIFSSGPNTIRPEAPAMSPRQFTEHAQASLRAHGISANDMPDPGLIDRAYAAGKVQALDQVRRQAEQVLAGLEANLNDPRLVAQARRQILDSVTEAYANRIEKKLAQIDKHIARISGLGRLALGRQRRTKSELASIGILTREIAGITMLGDAGFELNFYSNGRNWLEVTKLIPTGPQVVSQLKAIANAYPGLLYGALQSAIDVWVGEAKGGGAANSSAADKLRAAYPGLSDRRILRQILTESKGDDNSPAYRAALFALRPPSRPSTSTLQK